VIDLPFERNYLIHGVPLRVASELQPVLEAIENRLGKFRHDNRGKPGAALELLRLSW
jgi:hypothetical protein